MGLKFCPKCGKELVPNSESCKSCKSDLSERIKSKEREEIKYGSSLNRFLAFMFDFGIVHLIYFFFVYESILGPIVLQLHILIAIPIIISVYFSIGFFYFWLQEAFLKGQTLGKMICQLRTVDMDTLEPTSLKNYAINTFTKGNAFLIPPDLVIGLLKNPDDPMKRVRYTQILSKTVVISTAHTN